MILPLETHRIRVVDKPTQIGTPGQTIVVRPGTVVIHTHIKGALLAIPRVSFDALYPQAKFDPHTREYTLPEPPRPRKRKTTPTAEKTDDSAKES